MKLRHKVIIGSTLIAGLFAIPYLTQNRVNSNVRQYVGDHLEKIIAKQEERLGIKHFGVPKISFEQPSEVKDLFPLFSINGTYASKKDEIYLSLRVATTPNRNLTDIIKTIYCLGSTHNVKETLDHELGHFYADKLNESLGNGDWPILEGLGIKLVSEGIAEYFKKTMNEKPNFSKNCSWPKKEEDFLGLGIIYWIGFHLVKPIIDEYGKEGIEYLIANPPKEEDLTNLQTYQEKILLTLSNQLKK